MLTALALQNYGWLAALVALLTVAALALLLALMNARSALAAARHDADRLNGCCDALADTARKDMQKAAKDLHESVGQLLSAAQLTTRRMHDMRPDPLLENAINTMDQSISELRSTINALRNGLSSDLPLGEALALDAERLRRVSRVQAELVERGLPPTMSNGERIILYHGCQQLIGLALARTGTAQLKIAIDAQGPLLLHIAANGHAAPADNLREADALAALNERCRLIGYAALAEPHSSGTSWLIKPIAA
ncbi:MAG TPA: histidine kinase [Flavobacteriales bacterium]|nr:histidine kinase [Flavobacteriales bacterium]